MNDTNTFDQALERWLERANKIAYTKLTVDSTGSKYLRIGAAGSAFAFIDRSNGNVLKAATFRGPAKHARGNIYIIGEEGIDKYGAHYLYR